MSRIARLNMLDHVLKEEVYHTLIPRSFFSRYDIDPESGLNSRKEQCISIHAPRGGHEAAVGLKRTPLDRDYMFYIEVADSRDLRQLLWDYININDPDSQRFNTDMTPDGLDRWMCWNVRNLEEEYKAKQAALAPGQCRKGLRLMSELNDCLDRFCERLGFKSIFLEALFYHNAICFERHGFRYFEGEPMMCRINELFQPGRILYQRLDDSCFRKKECCFSVCERSWAIHDGILEGIEDTHLKKGWQIPKMYRMAGRRHNINTFPEGVYQA